MKKTVIAILIAALVQALPLNAAKRSEVLPAPPKGYNTGEAVSFYYLQAVKYLNIYNDKLTALRSLDKALEKDSTHSPSYYEKAKILMYYDPDYALKNSYEANRLDSGNVWYKEQLGRLLIMNGKFGDALLIYDQLIKLAPNDPNNYRFLAALHSQTGQPFTAISILDSAEVKFGMIEEISAYKRELLIETGLIDKAITESKIMTQNFPYDEENYIILGQLYARQKKDSLALDAFAQAAAINPDNINLLGTMSEYYRQTNDIQNFLITTKKIIASDALGVSPKIEMLNNITQNVQFYRDHFFGVSDLFSTLVIKYPDDFDVAKIYAGHLIRSGDIEGALNVYKRTLEVSPRVEAFDNILDIESYLERPDSVTLYADMAIRLFPRKSELYMRKGYALYALKNYKESEASMRKALKYAESDSLKSSIYANMGDMKHRQNEKSSTYFRYYAKAIRLNPNNVHALNNYSYYLVEADKNLEKALEMIERVMKIEPSNSTYIDTYGWALYKLGRYEEAKKVMRQAVSLDSSASPTLLAHYGDVLYKLNDIFMASVYWKKALEKGYDKAEIEKRLKMIEGK